MKKLTISLIFILTCTGALSQSNETEFSLYCDLEGLDSVKIMERYVSYKVLSRRIAYYDSKGNKIYAGDALIRNLKTSDVDTVEIIVHAIGKKYLINELNVFLDCKARRIYYQAMEYLPGQEDYLKKNHLGKYNIK